MKKYLLPLLFLLFQTPLHSQELYNEPKAEEKIVFKENHLLPQKEFGTLIWSEDFNDEKWANTVNEDSLGYLLNPLAEFPDGWKFVDSTNRNFFWHWSNVGPRGGYTSFPDWAVPNNNLLTELPQPNTIENGFMLLESDYFNTNPQTGEMNDSLIEMNSYFEFGPIDMSQSNGAIFNCKYMGRFCCDWQKLIGVLISTNYNLATGTGDWTFFALGPNTPNSSATLLVDRDAHIDISNIVLGADSVYFRIINKKTSHYYVIIDDIRFYEPPSHNLVIKDTWADYMYDFEDSTHLLPFQNSVSSYNFYGGYSQIPQSLVAPFVKFRSAVYNFATETATNSHLNVKIFKNSILDFEANSPFTDLPLHQSDTFRIETQYTPIEIGNYQISMTLVQDAEDEVPEDNGWEYNFQVSKDTYSRVTPGGEPKFSNAGPLDWAPGGFDGDVCAQMFDFPATVEQMKLKAINVYFQEPYSTEEQAAIEQGEFSMIARIYKIDENNQIMNLGIASNKYTLSLSDTNSWVTLEFADDEDLNVPGGFAYMAGIETYTGSTNQSLRFEIGNDLKSTKQPLSGGFIYLTSQNQWFLTGDNYAINLILTKDVPMVNVTFKFGDVNCFIKDGLFDPTSDTIYVYGNFNNWIVPGMEGSLMLSNAGGDSIYTGTTQLEANYGEMQYKYFINAGLEGGEWEGEPYRVATVTDEDMMLFDYLSCEGVKQNLMDGIELYPNPFNQNLVIESCESGWKLEIRDVLGKSIKKMRINDLEFHLNLSELNSGIYFLIISDLKGYSSTHKIIKNK